eukprot:6950571-Prymnesium_polylepis.1
MLTLRRGSAHSERGRWRSLTVGHVVERSRLVCDRVGHVFYQHGVPGRRHAGHLRELRGVHVREVDAGGAHAVQTLRVVLIQVDAKPRHRVGTTVVKLRRLLSERQP